MGFVEEREIKRDLYDHFAEIGKAFGSARRLELIDLLSQSDYTVERLAEEADMSVANTSQHLKTLRTARLVDVRRVGVEATYSLAGDAVYETWQMIRNLGESSSADIERLAQQLLTFRDERSEISFNELVVLLNETEVTVLDVRPEREYEAGHVEGALSAPLVRLEEFLPELNVDQEIVVYCRGSYSTLADKALRLLLDNGFDARRLAQGFPEWRAQGMPVEEGAMAVPSAS
jgi:rhodanese-related sulfurtransferase